MTHATKLLVGSVLGAAALALAAPASAFVLVEGTGWQNDTITAVGVASAGSPITFTCDSSEAGENCAFSLTDAFIVGDHYNITGDITAGSSLKIYPSSYFEGGVNSGPFGAFYGPAWTNPAYEHLQVIVAPGTYTISVFGNCGGGCPAGFGYRLDSIPEPGTWALMLVGFAGLGAGLRARRKEATLAA